MSVFLQPIYTQTVGAGGASSIAFNNIPQTFTDLKIVASVRTARSAGATDDISIWFNGNTSALYSIRALQGSGSAASSFGNSSQIVISNTIVNGNTSTASTFGSFEVYIPNYTGANFKSLIIDSVQEDNASGAFMRMIAGLFSNTSAITSISFQSSNGFNVNQYSTFSLYGVLRQGI
jgi:hypothetical protein